MKPKFSKGVEIVELREIEGDWMGDVTGYFAVGEWDEQSFAIAVNQDFNLADQGNYVATSEVRTGRCRKIPSKDGTWMFRTCSPDSNYQGAFMATYVFF